MSKERAAPCDTLEHLVHRDVSRTGCGFVLTLRRLSETLCLTVVRHDDGRDWVDWIGWHAELVAAITRAQSQLVGTLRPRPLFEELLKSLLDLSESEYGFIGEVLHDPDGAPYLRAHVIANVAWSADTRRLYDENERDGLELHDLDSLLGVCLRTAQPVISNAPSTDPRRGGLPRGHPPLDAFLGVPLNAGGAMVGMIGVANRVGGYDPSLVDSLGPFLQTCANAVFAVRADAKRREAEERLRVEEAKSRAMLGGVPAAIFTIHRERGGRGLQPGRRADLRLRGLRSAGSRLRGAAAGDRA